MDETQDPSTMVSINNLLANMGALGLAIYSNVTQKPVITTPAGSAVIPVQAAQSGLNTILIVALVGVALIVFME